MQLKRKISRLAAVLLSAALLSAFGAAEYYSGRLPGNFTAEAGSSLKIAEYPEISCCGYPFPGNSGSGRVTLSLFGAIPVKCVDVREAEAPTLIAGGMPFGIKLLMKGVMVTDTGSVTDENGREVCPAELAGIENGDIICLADGEEVSSNSRLRSVIAESGGENVRLTVSRNGREFTTALKPVYSPVSESWQGGMWVRDSIAGIGTVTFIDKSSGRFAGLGHPICDSDTGELVPVSSGEAVPVDISGTRRGEKGIPGELRGTFVRGGSFGTLDNNTGCGIFGSLNSGARFAVQEEYPLGYRQDIRTGSAEIISTVSGSVPRHYSIEIESIDYNSSDSTKNMVIRITDPTLISASGGIVQGMSGSPVIQDGRLIGAVTHVFVADPTRGYAVFAESMAAELCGGK